MMTAHTASPPRASSTPTHPVERHPHPAASAALAALLKIDPAQVLPFSTGVIMEPLPVERIAVCTGISAYELITKLTQRVAMEYIGD